MCEIEKQIITISDNQLWELIGNDFIRITNDDGSVIQINVKKKIDKETFSEKLWFNRLKDSLSVSLSDMKKWVYIHG